MRISFSPIFRRAVAATLALGVGMLLGQALSVNAASSPSDAKSGPKVEARLIAPVRGMQPGKSVTVGVHLKTPPDWHTYWKNPGESGLETHVRWRLPEGFSAGPLQWPAPHRFEFGGVVGYGYPGEVLLTAEITTPADLRAGTSVNLEADVDWLACREACVPGRATVALALPVANAPPARSVDAALFEKNQARLPHTTGAWDMHVQADSGAPTRMELRLTPRALPFSLEQITSAEFFPDATGLVVVSKPTAVRHKNGQLMLTLEFPPEAQVSTEKLSGILVVQTRDGLTRVDEIEAKQAGPGLMRARASGGKSGAASLPILITTAGFAFLGGLLLNLMPCVLPVLSLKVLALVEQAGQSPRAALRQAGAYTIGVVASCWVLAGALLFLRAAGEPLGWGFQMQSPIFVGLLAALFWVLALNFLGVFEIGASLVGVDANVAGVAREKSPLLGAFATGALAVVAATPCTAPFMGSALGLAASQPAIVALALFTCLGLGLAAPYLVLARFPALLRWVPKPGAWMETLKNIFGFVLAATVLYLAWVVGVEAGTGAVVQLLGALWIIGLAAWSYGRWATPVRTARTRWTARGVALLLLIGAVMLVSSITPEKAVQESGAGYLSPSGRVMWEPYSHARVDALRAEGRPVFVDFTAAWCLTCQVNKRVALYMPSVEEAFVRGNVAALRADWTRQDPTITRALSEFGRNGVPLYVLYPADAARTPALLPEVLSPGIVLKALEIVQIR